MSFDESDEYQWHAYFMLSFLCDDCGLKLEDPVDLEPVTDEWCAEFANRARSGGWFVPPRDEDGRHDIATCYCRACALRLRLSRSV